MVLNFYTAPGVLFDQWNFTTVSLDSTNRPVFFILMYLLISHIIKKKILCSIDLWNCVEVVNTSVFLEQVREPAMVKLFDATEEFIYHFWARLNLKLGLPD
jgi:hypothetical protein